MGFVGNILGSAGKAIGSVVSGIGKVVSSVIGWLVPKPIIPSGYAGTPASQGVLVNKDSNNASIPIVYGERQVGISRVFVESSGADNQYLYIAGVLCEGGGSGIESIQEIYIDDKLVIWSGALTNGTIRTVNSSDTNFYKDGASLISIQSFYGLDNQSASSLLDESINWDSNYKLSGVAYVALRFKWNQDSFGSLPDVKVTLKGKKIYDPRLDTTKGGSGSHTQDDPTTWAYSDNSSLVLLDYLRNSRYGKGLPNDAFENEYDSFKNSANDCDTLITPYSGGTDIKIFRTNAVIDTSQKVIDNVKDLLAPMRALFTYTQGKYRLIVEGIGNSVLSLNSNNIIGGIKIYGEKKNSKYNRVIGTFVNPSKNWQDDTISFPPADDSSLPIEDKYTTLLQEDNNTELEGSFEFRNVTNPYQAEELCEIILRRSRNALGVELRCTSEALNLSIGDIINLTYDTGGFNEKPFRVLGLAINTDSTVDLQLTEHQNNFYTWTSKAEDPTIEDTTLPNPNSVQAPAIVVTDEVIELFDGSVVSKMVVTITNNDSFADEFEVEYKESSETSYRLMGRGINQIIEKYPVKEGAIYNIRARTINTLGARSNFTSANHEVVTAFLPPSDVTNYNIDVVGDKLHHFFNPISDLDLDFYEIRFTSDTTETQYSNTTILVPRIGRPATSVVTPFAGSGKFFIKAVDKFGIRSANATSVVISSQIFEGFQSVQTITEETAFTGVKTDCAVVDNTLVLSTSAFDSISGNFDDAVGLFDGGSNSVLATGTYEFATAFDFSNSFRFRIILNQLNVDHLDYIDNFDSQAGDFDDVEGLFDGSTSEAISTNVKLQIATSSDNVTFSSFNDFKSGDYVTRAVKFKAILTSTDTSATPAINNLSLKFLLPTVIQDGSNLTSGTNNTGFPVTFTKAFYQTPSLTIIGQNLNSGDRFILNSKDRSSFNVEFLDSSGNTVNRTFDYQAVGIGSQQ
jgi:hypothetical protein